MLTSHSASRPASHVLRVIMLSIWVPASPDTLSSLRLGLLLLPIFLLFLSLSFFTHEFQACLVSYFIQSQACKHCQLLLVLQLPLLPFPFQFPCHMHVACILSVATLLQPLSSMAQLLISIYFGDFCQADAGLSALSLCNPLCAAAGCPHCAFALQISIAAFNAFHLIGRTGLSLPLCLYVPNLSSVKY